MTREDLENILNEIKDKINCITEIVYQFLKEKSSTYAELKQNIIDVINQIKWEQPDVAIWLSHELMERYEKENGKMPLQ